MKLVKSTMLTFLFILLLLTMSCSSSTQNNSGSLSGIIHLINDSGDTSIDPVDFSGITVAIYERAKIDTTLQRVNDKYPTIGMLANQQTEFDHRLQTPIKYTTTDATGAFRIDNIPAGTYNVVAMKEGWGYRYLFNTAISSGENTINRTKSRDVIELYRDIILNSYYESGVHTFASKHHIVANNDVHFLEGTSVEFAPGTVVRISPGKQISFNGNVTIQGTSDSLIHFTSDDGIYTSKRTEPQRFEKISFLANSSFTGVPISWLRVDMCSTGLVFYTDAHILNTTVTALDNAISVIGGASMNLLFSLQNSNLSISPDSPNYSISISNTSSALVEKSILFKSGFGIYSTNTQNLDIANNYLSNTQICIFLNQYVGTTILHNEISSGDVGIHMYFGVTSEIKYNNIYANIGLKYRSHLTIGTANFNNLFCSQWAVDFVTLTSSLGNLPAQNNYWNTTSGESVQLLINDKSDFPPSWQDYDSFMYVDYLPFRTSKVSNAGIL